jgi:acetyl esterase/lipase
MMQVGAPPVVAGMKAAAKDLPNVFFIPQAPKSDKGAPNFLPQYPAGHYNYEGMKRIGNFMADAYLKNYTKVVRPASVVAPQRPPDKAIVYKPTPQLNLKMHFYFPPGWSKDDRRPAIIFWCGGGFRSGGATQFLSQAEYFSSRGLVAIHTEYRGTKTEGVPVTDCQEDARSAMRWVKVHAAEYGIDPAKVVAAGGSAGGSLVMLTACPEGPDAPGDDLRISPRPAAMVLFNPAMGEALLTEIGHGGPAQTAFNAQILALSTPPPDQPPAILMYGEKDRAYLDEAKKFLEQTDARGIPCEVWVAAGAGHGFFNKAPWHGAALRQGDKFLMSLGHLEGAPAFPINPDAQMQPMDKH